MSLQQLKDQISGVHELRIAATNAIESLERVERLQSSNLDPMVALTFSKAEYEEYNVAMQRVRHLALRLTANAQLHTFFDL